MAERPWQADAKCIGLGHLFYADDSGRSEQGRTERIAAAKAICRTCPVQVQCLDYALQNAEPSGVWGGATERERRRMKKRKPPTKETSK